MRHRHLPPIVVAAGSIAALTLTGGAPASATASHQAAKHPKVTVLNDTVLAPFHISAKGHKILVADGGSQTVNRLRADGTLKVLASGNHGPAGDLSGVAIGNGGFAYTATDFAADPRYGTLTIHRPGHKDVVANLAAVEGNRNPDQNVAYGVKNPSQCVTDAFTAAQFPVSYTGEVDSHPYAVAYAGHGSWYVADAGGNDILKVNRKGHVSVAAVLPAQPHTITAAQAAGLGLPKCVAGVTYRFEAVPTDIQVKPNGTLLVTTLPGGPEGPALGARGSVYSVNPWTHHSKRVATGFAGATSLTMGKHGKVYVAELFAGQVSTIKHGKPWPVVSLPGVVSVEAYRGGLLAGALGPTDDEGNPTGPSTISWVRL